jgi:DnaJ-class molecular chaperone
MTMEREDEFEECPICSGTGWLREHRCPTCAGHGTVPVEPDEEDETDGEEDEET